MKIVWVGFHLEGKEALEQIAKGYNVVAAISLEPEAASKRSGVIGYKEIAQRLGISYHEVKHINDELSLSLIKSLKPDIMIVLGWSQILSDEVLTIPSIGTIGAHASLLPAYRGSAPINWALINGLDRTGNTLMWLNPGVDTGDIVDQMSFEITPFDTCESLYLKVSETNATMLQRSLAKIEKGIKVGKPQPITDEQLLPRRRPKDGLINFQQASSKVYDFIRALTRPYPGAFSTLKGEQVIFWKASSLNINIRETPGEVIQSVYSPNSEACGVAVACESGIIIINEVECAGKLFSGPEIINQFPVGTKFIS
jgi:methionyl-tRNA formyltransferase